LPGNISFLERFACDHPELVRAGRVQFLGRVDEALLGRLYWDADIFVAPSTYESFGLVFTEAMSCSLPCVGTNVGGISEVLGEDNARYLVRPGDAYALFEALSRLVVDASERARVGALNRQRWQEFFSASAMVHRTEAYFLRVVAAHAAHVRKPADIACMAGDRFDTTDAVVARWTGNQCSTRERR
jgi:glycosyltransferase involved in cell wall biosynthesis